METLKIKLITLLVIIISLPSLGSSQDNSNADLSFEVNRIYPYIFVAKDKLQQANSVSDLIIRYKSEWVREFISIEIITSVHGKTVKSVSQTDVLNQEQKEIMNMSDPGSNISINIKYIPENTLKQNDPKELNYTFTVDPTNAAKYPGGQQQMLNYLKEKAIDKIPSNSYTGYDLTMVKFTISEKGEVTNVHVFGSEYSESKKDKIDQLLIETISHMPCWKAAEYSNGTSAKQEFVLTVGNMQNCMINGLNIQPDGVPRNG